MQTEGQKILGHLLQKLVWEWKKNLKKNQNYPHIRCKLKYRTLVILFFTLSTEGRGNKELHKHLNWFNKNMNDGHLGIIVPRNTIVWAG